MTNCKYKYLRTCGLLRAETLESGDCRAKQLGGVLSTGLSRQSLLTPKEKLCVQKDVEEGTCKRQVETFLHWAHVHDEKRSKKWFLDGLLGTLKLLKNLI